MIFMFDVDGTLWDGQHVIPGLASALQQLRRQGHVLGLCTSQSPTELAYFLSKHLQVSSDLFNAGFVLEDGHVWMPPNGAPIVLTSQEALEEMMKLKQAFQSQWQPAPMQDLRSDGWGFLSNVAYPPVRLAPDKFQRIGTVSIWEKGPENTHPDYKGEYDVVMRWALDMQLRLGLHRLQFIEVGNGTLRILETGKNKGTGLRQTGHDLSHMIYTGNGMNDVPAAQTVRRAGGEVVAVANAAPAFTAIAHLTVQKRHAWGILELLHSYEQNVFTIIHNQQPFQVCWLTAEEELLEAKALDDLVFGQHQGITLPELQAISLQGGLLGLRDEAGRLLAETQVIVEPIPEHPQLAPGAAHCYGTAVHPDYQGRGLGGIMATMQERVARNAGKTRLTLSVRPENIPSILLRLRQGFLATGYDPHYYGTDELKDGRLLMIKHFTNPHHFDETTLKQAVQRHSIPVFHLPANLNAYIQHRPERFAIALSTDKLIMTARACLSLAFSSQFRGIGLIRPVPFEKRTKTAFLIFAKGVFHE